MAKLWPFNQVEKNWNPAFSQATFPFQVPTNPITGNHFFSVVPAGPAQYFDTKNARNYSLIYNACGPVKAIITKRASLFANGVIELVNSRTEREKRGPAARKLTDILERPNPLQSWGQFWAQVNVYVDKFGYCPVFKVIAVGMELMGDEAPVSALWCIPPQILEIKFTGKWRNQTDINEIIASYRLDGEDVDLPKEQVCLILDSGIGTAPQKEDSSFVIPDSRLKGLEAQASNLVAIGKAINTLVTKRGALGIFSNGAKDAVGHIPMDPIERDRVQNEFKQYGITGQDFQFIITDANLQWQSTTFPIKDFAFSELEQSAFSDLCNGLGMYEYLLAGKNAKGTTFANLKEAKAAQYQDYIIPESLSRIEQLSRFVVPASWNAYLWINYSAVEALQESRKDAAEALKAEGEAFKVLWELGLVTRNMILEALNRDTISRDEFNKYIFELQTVNNGEGSETGSESGSEENNA